MPSTTPEPVKRGRPRTRSRKTKPDPPVDDSLASPGAHRFTTVPVIDSEVGVILYEYGSLAYGFIAVLGQEFFKHVLAITFAVVRETIPIVFWLFYKVLPKPGAVLLLCYSILWASSCFHPIFCRVPGVAIYNPCCQGFPIQNATLVDVEPNNVMFITKNNELFANVISQASPLKKLPYEMTLTEMAIRDVRNKVTISSSMGMADQEQMLNELSTYIDFSGDTMNKLQSFTANLLGTVDRVLINTKWTILELNRLEGIHDSYGSLAGGFISLKNTIRLAFGLHSVGTLTHMTSIQLEKHMDNIEPDLSILIVEAQVLLNNFEELRQPLENVKMMTAIGSEQISGERKQLQAQQWTWGGLWAHVGGEADAMGAFGRQLDMLQKVDQVVNHGANSIASTLVELRSIDAQIKALRDSIKRTRGKEFPGRTDLEAIALGAERLSMLHVDERNEFRKIERRVWGKE